MSELTCGICLDDLKSPVSTPCGKWQLVLHERCLNGVCGGHRASPLQEMHQRACNSRRRCDSIHMPHMSRPILHR